MRHPEPDDAQLSARRGYCHRQLRGVHRDRGDAGLRRPRRRHRDQRPADLPVHQRQHHEHRVERRPVRGSDRVDRGRRHPVLAGADPRRRPRADDRRRRGQHHDDHHRHRRRCFRGRVHLRRWHRASQRAQPLQPGSGRSRQPWRLPRDQRRPQQRRHGRSDRRRHRPERRADQGHLPRRDRRLDEGSHRLDRRRRRRPHHRQRLAADRERLDPRRQALARHEHRQRRGAGSDHRPRRQRWVDRGGEQRPRDRLIARLERSVREHHLPGLRRHDAAHRRRRAGGRQR